jgi:hypothetical protein
MKGCLLLLAWKYGGRLAETLPSEMIWPPSSFAWTQRGLFERSVKEATPVDSKSGVALENCGVPGNKGSL